jgi:hypothetical protein
MFKCSVAVSILLAAGICVANSAELTVPSKRHFIATPNPNPAPQAAPNDESLKETSNRGASRKAGNTGTM